MLICFLLPQAAGVGLKMCTSTAAVEMCAINHAGAPAKRLHRLIIYIILEWRRTGRVVGNSVVYSASGLYCAAIVLNGV